MSKIEQLSERLTALHLEMERRFGQLRTLLLLISCAVALSFGPQTLLGQLLIDLTRLH